MGIDWTKFAWMAWTWQTAIFFAAIGALLVLMTVLAIVRPESPRAGILRISTTRGDRLFMSLLGAAFIYILWFRFGTETLWPPAVIAVIWAAIMFAFA
jgi:predicted small integral membrane protein